MENSESIELAIAHCRMGAGIRASEIGCDVDVAMSFAEAAYRMCLKDVAEPLVDVIEKFRQVDNFDGWHPKYREAIEAAKNQLHRHDRKG